MSSRGLVVSFLILGFVLTPHAGAYVGPGVGGSALTSVVGGVMAMGMFLLGSIVYPIRVAFRKLKEAFGIRREP
jgi:hypothetical protein